MFNLPQKGRERWITMSTITTRQNTINAMTMVARMYGRRSSRTRLEGYHFISKLLDGVTFNNEESVKSTFKNVANVLKSNGFEVEKWYAPLFYFEAQARSTGFEPIEWVKEELSAELFPEPKTAEQPKAAPEQPKTAEQPKKAEDVSFIDYLDESGFEKLSSNLNMVFPVVMYGCESDLYCQQKYLYLFQILGFICKEIQPVHSKGDQPWVFFGRNDAKAETPVLWPPHAKS